MTTPLPSLLDALFPRGHSIIVADSVLTGTATTDDGEVTVIGTTDKIEVGVDHALVRHPGGPRALRQAGSAPGLFNVLKKKK